MNMNDKEWNDFWDNEPDEDEDEYDQASDIDANNDETFNNAAEWDEDQHEELITRDMQRIQPRGQPTQPPSIEQPTNNNDSRWQSSLSTTERLHLLQLQQQQLLLQAKLQEQEHQRQQQQLKERQMILQQQMQHQHQQQLLSNARLQEQELQRHEQQIKDRQMLIQQQIHQPQQQHLQANQQSNELTPHPIAWTQMAQMGRQILRVDELEKQLRKTSLNQNSSGWSPFGGKDLFTNPDTINHNQLGPISQNFLVHGMQSTPLEQQQLEPELIQSNSNCLTVEELERQLLADRQPQLKPQPQPQAQHQPQSQHQQNNNNHINKHHVERREHRNNRDNRHHHNNNRRKPTIIPPQVQLSVIDKTKRLHPIKTKHSDEFLRDRVPSQDKGFSFKRHSTVSNEKVHHDGVLTEKERNWLTKIQEKIQADYDDNLDQDYYYLLYFNRSSMTDEAAQKPCGPGVLDRRFIPRERLLYNS